MCVFNVRTLDGVQCMTCSSVSSSAVGHTHTLWDLMGRNIWTRVQLKGWMQLRAGICMSFFTSGLKALCLQPAGFYALQVVIVIGFV